jgi:hypothetical protein
MNEGVLGLIMSREATKFNAVSYLAENYGIILTHENICVGLRPTISKNLSVFSCVSNQQPA